MKNLVIYFGASNYIFNGLGENFKNLEFLYIPDNSLKILERSNFANMTKLTFLELFDKQLEFIAEDSFWDLPNLEILDLYKCGIDELPKTLLKNLKNLKNFEAVFNRITFLDKEFFANNLNLEVIIIRNNQLKVIDVDFTKFSKLKTLRLEHNDCIDASTNSISIREIQDIVNLRCKLNSETELLESWWRNDE